MSNVESRKNSDTRMPNPSFSRLDDCFSLARRLQPGASLRTMRSASAAALSKSQGGAAPLVQPPPGRRGFLPLLPLRRRGLGRGRPFYGMHLTLTLSPRERGQRAWRCGRPAVLDCAAGSAGFPLAPRESRCEGKETSAPRRANVIALACGDCSNCRRALSHS